MSRHSSASRRADALTQEVAYNSLLIERRKLLHERAGQAIESVFAERLDDHLAGLAHHYSRSDNVEKAIEYLGGAAQQAWQRAAHADAISNFKAALALLLRRPESPQRIRQELLLQLGLGPALIPEKGYAAQDVEEAFARAEQLCERLGGPRQLFHALFGLLFVHLLRLDTPTAYGLAQRLQRLAPAANESDLQLLAHIASGNVSFVMGDLLGARQHLETAILLYDPERHRQVTAFGGDIRVNPRSVLGWSLFALGYPDQALKSCHEALAIAQSGAGRHSEAFAQAYLADFHSFRRVARATQESAERPIALSSEQGFPHWQSIGTTLRGWAIAQQGRYAEGIALIYEGSAAVRTMGIRARGLNDLFRLAEACIVAGRFSEGLDALTEVRTLVVRPEHFAAVELSLGKLLSNWGASKVGEAESCFRAAIEIAHKSNQMMMELQATTGLARLLASRGSSDEAQHVLGKIYN